MTAWATREAIDPTRMQSKVHRFLVHVVWEPVDGQYILWACQHIARDEHERGTLRDDVYDRFLRRPATVLVYDDPRFFMSESRRANIHHCSRQRYTTVAENLMKMRELWEFYGQPGMGVADMAQRATFLSCVSATVHSPAVPTSGSVKSQGLPKLFVIICLTCSIRPKMIGMLLCEYVETMTRPTRTTRWEMRRGGRRIVRR